MVQNSTKEVWNRTKQMTSCSKLAARVEGDPECVAELNPFFNRYDTSPTLVNSGNVSGPSTISTPIHTSAGDSALLPIKSLATPNPLQFANQPHIGVEDAVIFLTHKSLSHLENRGSTVTVMFFDFSSAFKR